MVDPPRRLPPGSPETLLFVVPSSSDPFTTYEVTARGKLDALSWRCTCPARTRCIHITWASLVQEAVGFHSVDTELALPPLDLLEWLRDRNRRERAARKDHS